MNFLFFLDCFTLKDGTDRLFRKVRKYQSTLCNIPEERRYHLHRGGIVTSRIHSHSYQVQFRG